jgi:hypothetical protein
MSRRKNGSSEAFSSNAVRLSITEWCAVFVLVAVAALFIGEGWKRVERFQPSDDYRIPYEQSEDYWLFDRYCREADNSGRTPVLGDSFVWGQYVRKGESLSHFLNQEAGSGRFVNAGLDGTHPLALEGLIRHHCAGLKDSEVILHLNLLWVTSPQADLQAERGARVNHPRLVPQFIPSVPSYQAPVSERIGVVLARHLPILDWARHLRSAYFSNTDLPHWTLDNPYLNPLRQITLSVPETDDMPHPDARAWFVEGTLPQELPWVSLEDSQQWRAFVRLVEILQERGNRVFVVVGPLNEHMLGPSSAGVYREILGEVEAWLKERKLPYYIPPVLPSELYADLSHPLGQGYALLAENLWEQISSP